MKILVMSLEGDALGLAHRMVLEGHTVDVWIKDPTYHEAGKGLVGRPDSWRPLVPSCDLVVCDMVGFSQYADIFSRYGKPTLSCNPVMDAIELDRNRGLETLRRVGISVPNTHSYPTPLAARALSKEWGEGPGYVIKGCGNQAPGKTYMCDSPELYDWALGQMDPKEELIVQETIPPDSSVEVSTEGWFNGRDWISPFNHTFEEKYFLPGNLGPMTGCMGNVVMALRKPDKLTDELDKIKPVLLKCGYRGPVDLNCLVTKDVAYGVELTCRMGYDAIEALCEGLREPVSNLLFETAVGIKKEMDVSYDYLAAIRISHPPYPSVLPPETARQDRGLPVLGITDSSLKHLFLCDIYKSGPGYFYAASDGVVAKATAYGRDVKETLHRAGRTAESLCSLDLQYRTDIGKRVDADLGKLREWGWIN